jgi:tetratricopeptide (TPR) repeat protein
MFQVKYIIDKEENTTHQCHETSDNKLVQHDRFQQSMGISISCEESNELIDQYERFVNRTFQILNYVNFAFRFMTLEILLNTLPLPSDKDDLIQIFKNEFKTSSSIIVKFKQTYTSSEAIQWYTEQPCIYSELNAALRTTNINHLVPFRFVLQDICHQLHDLMVQQADDEILTVYRGQQMSAFEFIELFKVYHEHSVLTINTFFSTSTNRDIAAGFTFTAGVTGLLIDLLTSVLFKITVRKKDASYQKPFANISKVSSVSDEAEVLFAPGHMFSINKIDFIEEGGSLMWLIEMDLQPELTREFFSPLIQAERTWANEPDGGLIKLGSLLVEMKRFDDADKLYRRLLVDNEDKMQVSACYSGLATIARLKEDHETLAIYAQKALDARFDIQHPSPVPQNVNINEASTEIIKAYYANAQKAFSRLDMNQPIDDIFAYTESDQYKDFLNQSVDVTFLTGKTMMESGMYEIAIMFFEQSLSSVRLRGIAPLDPIHVPRCYLQMGHAYRALNSNDKALENYKLALEQNVCLPLDEHATILMNIGDLLEIAKKNEEALTNYMQVAEIYHNGLTKIDPERRHHIEQCIKRVSSGSETVSFADKVHFWTSFLLIIST